MVLAPIRPCTTCAVHNYHTNGSVQSASTLFRSAYNLLLFFPPSIQDCARRRVEITTVPRARISRAKQVVCSEISISVRRVRRILYGIATKHEPTNPIDRHHHHHHYHYHQRGYRGSSGIRARPFPGEANTCGGVARNDIMYIIIII